MLCCIPRGSCTVQGGSATCQSSQSNLVEEIGREPANPYSPLLHCIFPFGVWIGARYLTVHSPGWIVCRYIQCCSCSSANKPVLPEVRIFWIYEYFSICNLSFTTIAPPCCWHCYWLFPILKYSYLLVIALAFHQTPGCFFLTVKIPEGYYILTSMKAIVFYKIFSDEYPLKSANSKVNYFQQIIQLFTCFCQSQRWNGSWNLCSHASLYRRLLDVSP